MADREQRLAIVVTAKDLAAGKLKGVRSELGKLNAAGKSASLGLGGIGPMANRAGSALGNLKGRVMGLTGAIGPLLGVGGLLGLGSLLSSSIRDAAEFGSNVSKVTAVTGLATPVASAMVDTLEKWGVTSDKLVGTLAKHEKAVATLASTKKKATAFEKQYGLSLTDANGKIADANTLLLRSADYFNSNATASDKATVMAKLWGKSWQDLIPILSKGSAAIRDEEANAIHLTDAQLKNIEKFRNAQRDFQDAFGDVQVKIGANLMPFFTSGLKTASAWFDANGDKVADFFRDAATFAGKAASAAGSIFSAVKGGWDALPEPIRQLLIGGFVANKASKFLFNIGIGDLVKGGAGVFSRGSSPANPMYVADVAGGLGGAGAGGGAAKLLKFAGALGLATAALELWANVLDPLNRQNAEQTDAIATGVEKGLRTNSRDVLEFQRGGLLKGLNELMATTQGMGPLRDVFYGGQFTALKASIAAIDAELARRGPDGRPRGFVGPEKFGPPAPGSAAAGPAPFTAKQLEAILQRNWLPKANDAELQGILERGIAAGFKPKGGISGEAVANTYRRNIQRAAEAQKTAIDSAKNLLHSDLVEIRNLTGRNPITNVTVIGGGGTPKVNTSTGFTVPPPQRRTILPGDSFGEGHARGTFGLTRGWTPLGYAGEAGGEAVAIVKNPRPIAGGSGVGRAEIAAIVAAIQIGLASATIRTRATVSARENESATTTRHRWSNPSTVTAH